MQKSGKDKNRDSRQAVAHAPDHGVNKPLRVQLDGAGQGKIEQLYSGFVDGVAKHLVIALQEHSSPERA